MHLSLSRLHTTVTAIVTPARCLMAAALLYALMVLVGAVPGKAEAMSAAVYDKLLHFAAYAVLSGLVYLGLRGRPAPRALRTLIVTAVLGGLDEAIQSFMPYRHANWADWRVDMLAALSCVALMILLHPLYSQLATRLAGHGTGVPSTASSDGNE
ncbi:MAG TPA: VanZ family protein [Noviherbaspirillum sp.]|nr:VanZ family protein [Noviherbaspirillum sp.]